MGILARRLMMAVGSAVSYLLLDKFTTPLSAGSVNGTNAEPGPGTRLVTDTGNVLSIASDEMQVTAHTGSFDPRVYFAESTPRTGGYTYINRLNNPSAVSTLRWGANNNTTGSARRLSFSISSTVLRVHEDAVNVFENRIVAASLPEELTYAIVTLPTQGALYLVRGGIFTTWALLYPGITNTTDPLFWGIVPQTATASSWECLYHGVADLSDNAQLNTLYGLANSRQSGTRTPGDTFTHDANGIIEFTVDTLPVGGQIEVSFRKQDSSNYWQLTINGLGDLELDEVVAGSATQRFFDSALVANGSRVVCHFFGDDIHVSGNNFYGSATNFQTGTSGEYITAGSGGVISNIVSWPTTLSSGAALTDLINAESGMI